MFATFDSHHQQTIRDYFELTPPAEKSTLSDTLKALADCRAELVGALKTAQDPLCRQQLKVLYEGLTVVVEFLAGTLGRADPLAQIPSVPDESAPAARDFLESHRDTQSF